MRKVAIVIPVFNEGESLEITLPEISIGIMSINPTYKIIYVDDGSTDKSHEILDKLKASKGFPNIEVLHLQPNQGYGKALRAGAALAYSLDFWGVVFMDSDLTNPPSEIPQMISQLEVSDLVKASRYLRGSDASEVTLQRRIYSVIGNKVLQILFLTHTKDITNGFRAWRLTEYMSFECERGGFDSIIEEFYYAKTMKFRITECPSVLRARRDNQRRSSSSYSLKALKNYLSPGLTYFMQRFK